LHLLMKMSEDAPYLILGAGLAGLSAAAVLTAAGKSVCVLEQNRIPGGCAASYPRKGARFEAGATTLVGLEPNMPLGLLQKIIGIEIEATKLETPMQIYLPDGQILSRFSDFSMWIAECHRVFGSGRFTEFWRYCLWISDRVWSASIRYTSFPPQGIQDYLRLLFKVNPSDTLLLPLATRTTESILKKFGLDQNSLFRQFVDQQLLITAQTYSHNCNALFGATALCYPMLPNYYMMGGIGTLAHKLAEWLVQNGSIIHYRRTVESINPFNKGIHVKTNKGTYHAGRIISAIPVNNLLSLWKGPNLKIKDIRGSESLWSAFQTSVLFRSPRRFNVLHYQVHVGKEEGLKEGSIFISLSHPDDVLRCPAGHTVASVSTHIPAGTYIHLEEKLRLETAVLKKLKELGIIDSEPIYVHSASVGAWEAWTGRAFGSVGGYPQRAETLPWQMNGARTASSRVFLAGDTVYPGQGIPGVVLSGIIAAQKVI
jgi:phytoene dehydrogenase-like protein